MGNHQTLPWDTHPIQFPPELPVSQRKEEIVSAIQAHQVVILSGETGSGKTTQIPKMCLEAGLGRRRKIACTQPRRVAALSVARRVAEELKVPFGAEVGAKIRFTDQTSKRTRVKFLTDGMLLSEIHGDPLMREYDAVIVDEAHERSLNIDFLLGHLNQLRKRRPDLKIVITSATIDTEKFSAAFDGAPILEVSGRVYPVDVIYAPLDELLEETGDFTYIEGIAESVQRIQGDLGSGDILVFLPTEKDIRDAMELLDGRFGRRMEIVPCFGRLSNADQQRIFLPTTKRKLVLATNIAETSLTIPGIRFVIDTGLARISRYNPRGRTKRLPIVKISQSSANQRKGRCGRVEDGICIRLYSEKDFESRPVHATPEIQRANLADVILRMLASKLGQVETFPFIDPPTPAAITSGYDLLQELGALTTQSTKNRPASTRATLTPLGHKLSRLPVDPTVGRMLLEAEHEGVVEQVLIIASALSIQDPRERPMDKEAAAKQAHARFNHKSSDFLTLLNIWDVLHDELETLSQSKLRKFCKQHFLNYLRMREWRDIYEQLKRAVQEFEQTNPTSQHPASSTEEPRDDTRGAARRDTQHPEPISPESAAYQAIHTCLLTGLLANIGRREETNLYRCPGNRKALVFPGSALFIRQPIDKKGKRKSPGTETAPKPKSKSPEWIVAGEIVETNRLYARSVAAIDPSWLIHVGEHIIARSYSEPQFLPKEGRVVARESIRIHGLEIQNRKVSYLKVDPEKATEIFIREALLNEEFEAANNWDFLDKNRKLMRRIQNAQTVASVAHWMGVEEAAFRFYKSRLQNVASIADLNRYLKTLPEPAAQHPVPSTPTPLPPWRDPAKRDNTQHPPHPLLLQESDLTASDDAAVDLSLFPETVELDNSALPIEYDYNPGSARDGVTLKLPYHKAQSLSDAMLDWLIPGHLEAKIHLYLKALPKDVRRRLLPLTETAKTISREIRPTGETLVKSLANHLRDRYSIETYASDWDESVIPDHLKMRVEVHDKNGQPVAEGRDLATIQQHLEATEAAASRTAQSSSDALWGKARERYERPIESLAQLEDDQTASLAERLAIGNHHGIPIYAFPALRAPSVSNQAPTTTNKQLQSPADPPQLSLFRSLADAQAANRHGIAALIEYELRRELAWIQSDLKEVERVGSVAVPFRPIKQLKEDVFEHIRLTLRHHNLNTLDTITIRAALERARVRAKGLLYKVVDQLKAALDSRQSLVIRRDVMDHFKPDIDRLLAPDFLRLTPDWALQRLPVYLTCIERRLEKRARDPQRYAQREKELQHYRARLAELERRAPAAEVRQPYSDLTRLRFSIEEFAISLFAQELGTAFPISPKKLDQAFDALTADLSPHFIHGAAASSHEATPSHHESRRQHHTDALPMEAGSAKSDPSRRSPAKSDRPTQADLESLKKLFG